MNDFSINDVARFGKGWRNWKSELIKIHFLVYRQQGPGCENGFAAVALELGLFGWGTTEDSAKRTMFEQVDRLLPRIEKKNEIFDILGQCTLEHMWAVYRQLLFLCGDNSLQGKNLNISEFDRDCAL